MPTRLFGTASGWLTGIGGIGLVAMMLLITADATMRYFFNRPIAGAYEITEVYLMPAGIFLALSWVQAQKGNVRVDIFVRGLSPRTQAALEAAGLALGLFFFALLVWRGLDGVFRSVADQEASIGLVALPFWPARLMVPIGGLLMCVQLTRDIVHAFHRLVGRSLEPTWNQR